MDFGQDEQEEEVEQVETVAEQKEEEKPQGLYMYTGYWFFFCMIGCVCFAH